MKYLSDRRVWLLIALNLLNAGLILLSNNWPLTTAGRLLIGFFALGNACLSSWLMWQVWKSSTTQVRNSSSQTD